MITDIARYKKGYKPEVTNPQHTKVEIFKGKVKRKCLNLGLEFSFLTNCFRQSINTEKYCVTNYLNIGLWKCIIESMKIYKPEVTNPQHTEDEIFKVKVKNKNLNSEIGFYFLTNCFRQSVKKTNNCVINYQYFSSL
jgi:hypothetical protein